MMLRLASQEEEMGRERGGGGNNCRKKTDRDISEKVAVQLMLVLVRS